jgi:hypothetical protein
VRGFIDTVLKPSDMKLLDESTESQGTPASIPAKQKEANSDELAS